MTLELDDIARTAINFTLPDGSQYQNVWHHRKIGAPGISDSVATTAIEGWCNATYAHLTDRVTSSVVPSLSYVDKVAFIGGEWKVTANIGAFTPTFVGSDAAEDYANQISPYVLYKTIRPRTVGRKFTFPSTEAYYDGSYINGTLVASLVDFATRSMQDIYLGPISDLEVGIVRTGVDAFYTFELAVVTNVCGSQRRRRPGEGS